MKIRTLSPMMIDHKRVEEGKVVEVRDGHARMMIYAGRAEAVDVKSKAEKATKPAGETSAGGPEEANKVGPKDALAASFGDDIADLLRDAGFADPEAVATASDDDLRAVSGIGPASVKKIREALEG